MKTDIRLFIFLTTIFIVTSCGHENANENSRTNNNQDTLVSKQNPSQIIPSDIISFPCAIILSPTNKTIDSLKIAGGEDFYIAADDNMYYLSIATTFLDSNKIKTIRRTSEGDLTFHMTAGKDTTLNLSDFYWDILLFNGSDKPILSDMTDFESNFKNYMRTNK